NHAAEKAAVPRKGAPRYRAGTTRLAQSDRRVVGESTVRQGRAAACNEDDPVQAGSVGGECAACHRHIAADIHIQRIRAKTIAVIELVAGKEAVGHGGVAGTDIDSCARVIERGECVPDGEATDRRRGLSSLDEDAISQLLTVENAGGGMVALGLQN